MGRSGRVFRDVITTMSINNLQKDNLKKETVDKACSLGQSLLRIHNRLIMEGYNISDGKIIPPGDKKVYNDNTKPKCI